MSLQTISDDAPGTVLFPEYEGLYELIAREITGLTDAQLDFRSDQWAWSDWSIRRQLSHMASLIYGWMVVRLGQTLFPDGNHGIENIQSLTASGFDRRLDDQRYWDLPPPVVSDDGRAWAYPCVTGTSTGGDEIFVVTSRGRHGPYKAVWAITLSDDGSRVAYGATVDDDPSTPWQVYADGVPYPVLEWCVRAGVLPTLSRWLRDGTHHMTEWRPMLPATTPASQMGILHGTIDGIPAFRWVDRRDGKIYVANKPKDAALIESQHSDGRGLLADDGVSISNLFTGDAPIAVATMSAVERSRESQSGVRFPPRSRGRRSARAAFIRNWAPNVAEPGSSARSRSRASWLEMPPTRSVGGATSALANRKRMPSSPAMTCVSTPSRS